MSEPMTEQRLAEIWQLCEDACVDPMAIVDHVPDLLSEVGRLRAELGHVEPSEEPACEATAGGDTRCECCGVAILAGEPVDLFSDGGRWVWVHPGPCPEPDLWTVSYMVPTSHLPVPMRVVAQWPDGRRVEEPFEDAVVIARRLVGQPDITGVRVRCVRKETSRG